MTSDAELAESFFEDAVRIAEQEARRLRREGYTPDAARHAAIYGFIGDVFGDRALEVIERVQAAAESVP